MAPDDVREDRSRTGVWRRAGLLPRTAHAVTLGEGATPLLPLPGLLGDRARVHAKVEALNPTLSFKDRAMALAASVALDLGLPGLVLASTGNAAVSAAAYAAAAGLPCRVLCGTGSRAALKLAAAAAHGADVGLVEGDYSSAYARAVRAEDEGWFNVTTTYRNPVLAEAYRALALELLDDLGHVPDVVVVPVGAGPLLRGLLGGFQDAVSAGVAARPPRLVGVQARACAPLARAWRHGNWAASLAEPPPVLPTRAGAIADSLRGYEREGLLTLEAVRDSGGTVVDVGEDDMAQAMTALAGRGLLVEPAAAAALAALADDEVAPLVPDGGSAVIVLTGHGAKERLAAVPAVAAAEG
ncbi:pyridoxal-phosphate dependent enzyme [Geodermatophilus sp. URMC 61]|uniref:pyridoxal-phosphate dependent enzyme n=1 Tax=Geodermatophilus sp. URMC 61 TaxID=3423411 RepID=UPI00406BEF2B